MNKFCGIDVRGEGRVVQYWFSRLRLEAQEEILNLVLQLESLPMGLWRRPEFATLQGEEPLSELRPDDVRCDEGIFFYRIYGLQGYPDSNSYTFLHGTDIWTRVLRSKFDLLGIRPDGRKASLPKSLGSNIKTMCPLGWKIQTTESIR